MPLQNRVDPFGEIHATPFRGTLMGNRGIIHNPARRALLKRRWTTKAWIICVCDFRGNRRVPMARQSWTELFFLDEVTALAAGHRPCFYCQRERAREFAGHFGEAFAIADPKAGTIDARLHGERLASGGPARPLRVAELHDLPDGVMVANGPKAFALAGGMALPWRFEGYDRAVSFGELDGPDLRLLTPATTVAILRAGYHPILKR